MTTSVTGAVMVPAATSPATARPVAMLVPVVSAARVAIEMAHLLEQIG